VTRAIVPLVLAVLLAATPARADHGAGLRIEGLSPLASALVTGGLALLVALIVVVLIVVLTRPSADRADSDHE
jgi:hypothetical protein